METAIFAGGCFWCIEAVYNRIQGVEQAVSGYINGHTEAPSYAAVCQGDTGHAEAVQIRFDPTVVSYRTLLEILFSIHDPTQLNRQGHDVGTQYRSGIYYLNPAQQAEAEAFVREAAAHFSAPIVTEILPAARFWPAEDYHQGYFLQNPGAGYCQAVVGPKFFKARERYAHLWKD